MLPPNHLFLQRFSQFTQETIFVADGNHDYRTQCAISGEPLIQSMEPTNEEEAQGYEFEAPLPLVKLLVGDLQHRKVYDVRVTVSFLVSSYTKRMFLF
jgi:hypothetical protein